MDTVLVTGASGYIGQSVLPILVNGGYHVHAISTKPAQNHIAGPYWHQVDLMDLAQVQKTVARICPHILLHLAWFVEHNRFWSAPENWDWMTCSEVLAKCVIANGAKRIVAAGTCAEYDWSAEPPFREHSTPFHPESVYGQAKLEFARRLQTLARRKGVTCASAKIFFPFGRNEPASKLIPHTILALLDDKCPVIANGTNVRDFIHVDEVARALIALLQSPAEGAVNIGTGFGHSVNDVVGNVASALGRPDLAPLSTANSPDTARPILADVHRLRDEVGFRPELSFLKHLTATINWWKTNRLFHSSVSNSR